MNLDAHVERLTPHLTVFRPLHAGRMPVVLQFHGCGGVGPMQRSYAEAALSAGVAAVVVDSLAPRGIGEMEARAAVCTGLKFRGAERALDVLATLQWLREQPWADPDRVAAIGWSHGAWAIMEALAGTPPQAQGRTLPLKSVLLFYPYCGPLARTRSRGWGANRPCVYAVIGGRDLVVGRTLPERALRRLEADGLTVRSRFFPDATHGFDEEGATGDPRVRYRADLAEQSRAFFVEALRESLGTVEPIHGRGSS
ncbi:MAG TPA: dienelactone hydrolase family protein [Caulobacteraceae bacterium]|jgi:dienelactone hydrolase